MLKVAFRHEQNVSVTGDRLSITIVKKSTKEVVASLCTRTGRIEYISEIIVDIHRKYFRNTPIIVERNNFGKAVIEQLEAHPDILSKLFFTYEKKKNGKYNKDIKIYGINTTKENREKYFNTLLNTIHDNPACARSEDIINELLTLETKAGKIQAMSGCHDDAVLSYAIGLYCIEYLDDFLIKFTRQKIDFEISLSKIITMNDKNISSKDLMRAHSENINYITNDDEELAKRMLGDFYKSEVINDKLKNPYTLFSALNS